MWKEMRTEKRFARILSYPGIGLGCRHRLRHRSRYCSHRRHRRRCRRHQRQHRRYRSFFPQTKGIGSILDNEEPFHCKNKVDWITLGRQQEANLSQSRLFSVPEKDTGGFRIIHFLGQEEYRSRFRDSLSPKQASAESSFNSRDCFICFD